MIKYYVLFNNNMEIASILPIVALVISGLVWNNSGYFAAWRKNHKNPAWKGFEKRKLKNDLILGTVLGIGTVVSAYMTTGDLAPITTAQEFFVAVGTGFGAVAAVDKFIIGGMFGKS